MVESGRASAVPMFQSVVQQSLVLIVVVSPCVFFFRRTSRWYSQPQSVVATVVTRIRHDDYPEVNPLTYRFWDTSLGTRVMCTRCTFWHSSALSKGSRLNEAV